MCVLVVVTRSASPVLASQAPRVINIIGMLVVEVISVLERVIVIIINNVTIIPSMQSRVVKKCVRLISVPSIVSENVVYRS